MLSVMYWDSLPQQCQSVTVTLKEREAIERFTIRFAIHAYIDTNLSVNLYGIESILRAVFIDNSSLAWRLSYD
ncbi:hypothetical protein CsSME_00037239 [Camellia sinensis var. sinensis]